MKPLSGTERIRTKLPFISLGLAALSLLLFSWNDAASFFQYDRSALADGELWRIFTSHFTHWSFDHFLWCIVTFIAIGYICEDISPIGYLATLVITSCFIPGIMWLMDTGMHMYRGLSGLASATFVFGALMMMRNAYQEKNMFSFSLAALGGVGYLVKILYEFFTGETLFVNSNGIFTPVPQVHLVGGVVGLLVALFVIVTVPSSSSRDTPSW